MIDHVIMFRPVADLSDAEERHLFERLGELANVTGVVDFALGKNFGDRSRGFDICMRVTFADRAALDAYEADPQHLEIVAYNRTVTSEHLCVDYEWNSAS
jgi:hypothetical protein